MITIYSKDDCMKCKLTKRAFSKANIKFKEINVDHQPNPDEIINQLKIENFRNFPVVKTDNDSWCDLHPDKINAEIKRQTN